jgi:hypothetical protein
MVGARAGRWWWGGLPCICSSKQLKGNRFTHIKPLLGEHLLHQQHLRDPQLHADVWDGLAVDEVAFQAYVPGGGVKNELL